jgi:hypothetical protein
MKLTTLMVSVLLGIVVYVSLFNFLADGVVQYGVQNTLPSDFNNSYLIIQGELNQINKTTTGIKDQLSTITAQSGVLDYLGFFFNAGYQALTGAGSITKSVFVITDTSLEGAGGFSTSGQLLKTFIYASVIIMFFVGIIMHAVIKSDRI